MTQAAKYLRYVVVIVLITAPLNTIALIKDKTGKSVSVEPVHLSSDDGSLDKSCAQRPTLEAASFPGHTVLTNHLEAVNHPFLYRSLSTYKSIRMRKEWDYRNCYKQG